MPILFKDVGKRASDLFNKGYPTNDKFSWRWQLNNHKSGDTTYESKVQRESDGSVSGSVVAKSQVRNFDSTTTIETNNTLKIELVRPNLVENLKTTLEGVTTMTDPFKSTTCKLALDYNHRRARVTSDVVYELFASKPTVFNASILFGHEQWVFGGDVQNSNGKTTQYTIQAARSTKDDEFVAFLRNRKSGMSQQVGVAYSRLYREGKFVSASEISVDTKTQEKSIQVGFSNKVSDELSYKTKVGTTGVIGVSTTTKLNSHTDLLVGVELSAFNLSGGDHRVHFDVTMHP